MSKETYGSTETIVQLDGKWSSQKSESNVVVVVVVVIFVFQTCPYFDVNTVLSQKPDSNFSNMYCTVPLVSYGNGGNEFVHMEQH